MARQKRTVRFFDVKAWMGWDNLAMWSDNIRFVVKNLFVVQQTNINESFDEAITRLELDEKSLNKRQTEFHYTAIFYGMLSLSAFGYCAWHCGQSTRLVF